MTVAVPWTYEYTHGDTHTRRGRPASSIARMDAAQDVRYNPRGADNVTRLLCIPAPSSHLFKRCLRLCPRQPIAAVYLESAVPGSLTRI